MIYDGDDYKTLSQLKSSLLVTRIYLSEPGTLSVMTSPAYSCLLRGFDDRDHRVEDVRFVGLHDVPTHHHFVDDEVRFLYVKHYLEHTNAQESVTHSEKLKNQDTELHPESLGRNFERFLLSHWIISCQIARRQTTQNI